MAAEGHAMPGVRWPLHPPLLQILAELLAEGSTASRLAPMAHFLRGTFPLEVNHRHAIMHRDTPHPPRFRAAGGTSTPPIFSRWDAGEALTFMAVHTNIVQ